MTTPTYTMPMDTPVGRLVLESDGDVLIGIWLPTSGMKARGRRPGRATGPQGHGHPARGVLRPGADRVRRPDGARRHRIPKGGVGRALPHPLRRDHQLRRAGPTGRAARGPRAVGQANGKNPIAIIVPCHRVVASNGIGGYGGGLPMKRALLAVEGLTARRATAWRPRAPAAVAVRGAGGRPRSNDGDAHKLVADVLHDRARRPHRRLRPEPATEDPGRAARAEPPFPDRPGRHRADRRARATPTTITSRGGDYVWVLATLVVGALILGAVRALHREDLDVEQLGRPPGNLAHDGAVGALPGPALRERRRRRAQRGGQSRGVQLPAVSRA